MNDQPIGSREWIRSHPDFDYAVMKDGRCVWQLGRYPLCIRGLSKDRESALDDAMLEFERLAVDPGAKKDE